MSKLAEVQKNIVFQWEKMIANGRLPVMEYQIGEDDYLIVDLELVDEGSAILFSFDRYPFPTADVWFSGDVIKVLDNYQITIDEFTDDLDIYLQQIDQEMLEGFILPNGLYYCED